ncbi:phosphate ABC transporter permease subunit PstC [Xylanimonas allomyrinae]|uniref:Phosphate transport system permease protein n=1 Tax=Xylanimonas allomyrinae TaxID=2509459 RepID=A0A4P6ELI2_9MICO|nr:phosphate ABC transporter permease subunit PstC [Xylanimonas allomyrinae]QAY63650.1 phosphate ABC transporter permease subunit PstC [Xylanimonas allomyrinae]
MTTTDSTTETGPVDDERPRQRRHRHKDTERGFSRGFRLIATAAGILLLLVLAAVALFLLVRGWAALTASDAEMQARGGLPSGFTSLAQYVAPLVFGTLLAALLALVIATPVAVGIALFVSHYAPRRLAGAVGFVIDLLAAIPSVVFGLWGVQTLGPVIAPVWKWVAGALNLIPGLTVAYTPTGRALATTSVVLAIMILPIITAVSREVFKQTPRLHEEAALALGATRWEVVRTAVLPFGRSGVISAAMLGLGRALGETMAVLMILSPGLSMSFQIFGAGQHTTIAANIAANFPEASGLAVNTLIATGLALFVITLAVNMAARAIVARRKDFSGAN